MDPRDLPDPDLTTTADAVRWFLQVLASNVDLTPMSLLDLIVPEYRRDEMDEFRDYIETFEAAIGTAPRDPVARAEFWGELEASFVDRMAEVFMGQQAVL